MKKEEKKNIKKNENIEFTLKFNKEKLLKGIGVVALVLVVLGLAFAVSNNSSSSIFEFVQIDVDKYLDLMKEEEKSIIYVARPGCSWCQKETPVIRSIGSEYNLKIYYLNTDGFWNSELEDYTEDGKKFVNSSEKYKEGFGTPNTIIVQNGKIVDGEFGYAEKSALKSLFIRNGFIDE